MTRISSPKAKRIMDAIEKIVTLSKKIEELEDEIHFDLNEYAADYCKLHLDACEAALGPDDFAKFKKFSYRWFFGSYHYIQLDRAGFLEYWQSYYGDPDVCIHACKIDPRLFTASGKAEMFEELKQKFMKEKQDSEKATEKDRLKKIEELKARLKELER